MEERLKNVMRTEVDNRQKLAAYILGTLPESERTSIADMCFEDDDLFSELLDVENDLVDQYVRGKLGPNERRRLESYISRLPQGQHKLAVATELMKTPAPKAETSHAALNESFSRLDRLRGFLFGPLEKPQAALRYSLVALFLVLGLALAWVAIYNRQLRDENERLLSALATRDRAGDETLQQEVQALRRALDNQREQTDQLESDLEREREQNKARANKIERVRSQTTHVSSLELTASQRDISTPSTLVLKPGIRYISLIVPVSKRDTYIGYRAILQTNEGNLVWQQESQPARPMRIRKNLVFELAADQLSPAMYKLTLVLKTTKGETLTPEYYFIVKR